MAQDHRDPRRPHFWPGRRGQLLADGGDRALWTVLRDTRRYEGEGRGESDPQSRRLRTTLRGREVPRDLESRVYAVRSAGGRLAQAAPRAFRRHGGRPRASDVDDAARPLRLRHRPVHADHRARRRGDRNAVRPRAGRRILPGARGSRAGGGVPARRRRVSVERGARLRAAPHPADHGAPRLAAGALEAQRQRSRGVIGSRGTGAVAIEGHAPTVVVKRAGEWRTVKPKKKQKWVGYETTRAETDVLKFRQAGDRVEVVLEQNPFYAESGGQVSDTGRVKGEGWELEVSDVKKVDGTRAVVGHFEHEFEPTPAVVEGEVRRRKNIERNHTATHLVHAGLRKILGAHVRQQGSVVAPDRLRFDFAHHGPVDDATLARIDVEVNTHIWENLAVETREVEHKETIAPGAMAFFTEKYGDS